MFLLLQVEGEGREGQGKNTTGSDQSQIVTSIPTATHEQETVADEDTSFVSMDTTRPVVMVAESVMPSVQDGGQDILITTDYQDNNQPFLGEGENKLVAQDTQHYTDPQQTSVEHEHTAAQYTTKVPSSQIPIVMETTQDVSVSMETTQSIPVSMETSQGLTVSMVAASGESKEHVSARENSLEVTEGEQGIQDYNTQTPCSETAANEPISMSLMFENGQQQTDEESAVVSHANAVPTINNTPAVFTQ